MAEPAAKNPYQAVSVSPGPEHCEAVREIADKRFLNMQAPMLPLDDCTTIGQCTCKYKKWEDRRQDDRRMIDNGIGSQFYHGEEKRTGRRGRRSTD